MKHGADNIVTAGMTAMKQKPKQHLGLNISTRVSVQWVGFSHYLTVELWHLRYFRLERGFFFFSRFYVVIYANTTDALFLPQPEPWDK